MAFHEELRHPASTPIRFYHRGGAVSVRDSQPTRTLLDWLREEANCTGTKEGCNEGDCGACTVVIGELAGAPLGENHGEKQLALKAVNACLQFLPTLNGKALFTVEDLGCLDRTSPRKQGALHPVQEAMVESHASQCGFCTPGFVMSLWACYEEHRARGARPSRQALADALSGNLCRCTGYRPILDAGERMFELPEVPFRRDEAVRVLESLAQGRDTFTYDPGGESNLFLAPRTLEELANLRLKHPSATLLAGGTDIGLWVNKQFRDLGDILYLGDVEELQTVEDRADSLRIGAGVTLENAFEALSRKVSALRELWLRFASPAIRHAGTLGGNIANGSPIGDAAPALLALDAKLELRLGGRVREMALSEFYVDYMKNSLERSEFVQALIVPHAAIGRTVRSYKISKRHDSDISAVCAGFAIQLDGDVVREIRLAFGGMAGIVRRAAKTEAALLGRPWTQAAIRSAQCVLADEFEPMSDMRGSAAFRTLLAQNMLERFWMETRVVEPLAHHQISVWTLRESHATS